MNAIEHLTRELEIRNFSKRTVKSYVFFIEKFLDYAGNKELNEDLVKSYIQAIIKNMTHQPYPQTSAP